MEVFVSSDRPTIQVLCPWLGNTLEVCGFSKWATQ